MKKAQKNKRIYVVELDPAVRKNKRFARANIKHDSNLPCLYVGRTGLTPEERFTKHKTGNKASRIVKRYGIRLRPDLYDHLPDMTFSEAEETEVKHAERLRDQGFAVWQK